MFPSNEATRSSIRRAAIIPRDTMRIRRRWRLGCLSVYRWNITSGQGGVRPDYSQDSFLPDGGEVQVQFHQRRGNSTWHFLVVEAYQREERDGARWGSVTFARMHAMVVAVVRGERKQASCRRLLAESQRLHLCHLTAIPARPIRYHWSRGTCGVRLHRGPDHLTCSLPVNMPPSYAWSGYGGRSAIDV